jgi:hypothetical protein
MFGSQIQSWFIIGLTNIIKIDTERSLYVKVVKEEHGRGQDGNDRHPPELSSALSPA